MLSGFRRRLPSTYFVTFTFTVEELLPGFGSGFSPLMVIVLEIVVPELAVTFAVICPV
jgi:hypothetical protein